MGWLSDCLIGCAGFNLGVAALSAFIGDPFYAVGCALAAVFCAVMAGIERRLARRG